MAEAKKKATEKNEETVKVNPIKAFFGKIGNWAKVNKKTIIGTTAGAAGGSILTFILMKIFGTPASSGDVYIELPAEDENLDSDVTSLTDAESEE